MRFLTLPEILEIHRDQINRYGGIPGIRDLALLKSAMAMPMATYSEEYLHTTIFEMAAAYLFHLVRNHPFLDGNKRVGAVATLIFLDLNGYEFLCPEDEFADAVIALASGDLGKAEATLFLQKHTRL
ncbi:MAG: type II toxin-antitoxin system death-on-curing family toxin [Candidatus Wallbacteria bacterium HGW-Wallbacteria-1]|uniref:Type II toxin-antitoxin system death-on-curing family toxin n=1 Tax=Candidatus Wallbacteria bacterium HGW-Wallbacteria-1 TaxID=2013854 RepID=A0A2N1PIF1_9BACT|nr:MAG: type II toxin-antitoxin system death-on-curing family toxin [Candidatus Wallbacteria bacterium HGW-Wallbacteria-1]